jgi:hypothetical protein
MKNKTPFKILMAGLALASLAFFSACTFNFVKGKDDAEKAVSVFHQRLDAGQYEEIYADLADEFKNVSTKEETLELFEAVTRKLGKTRSTTLQSWNAQTTLGGNFISLVYETEFEQGKGVENFTFIMKGKEAKIAGYHVNSKAFMK